MNFETMCFQATTEANPNRSPAATLRWVVLWGLVGVLAFFQSCKREGGYQVQDAQVLPAPTSVSSPQEPLVPLKPLDAGFDRDKAVVPSASGGSDPSAKLLIERTIDAYVEDCAHEPMTIQREFEDLELRYSDCQPVPEFSQNCEPESSSPCSSWECEKSCYSRCDPCDSRCITPCNQCKAKCGGDKSCVRKCAETRYACHGKCLFSLSRCLDVCEKKNLRCETDFEEKKKKQCPDCRSLRSCSVDMPETSEHYEECHALLNRNAKECLEWCGR